MWGWLDYGKLTLFLFKKRNIFQLILIDLEQRHTICRGTQQFLNNHIFTSWFILSSHMGSSPSPSPLAPPVATNPSSSPPAPTLQYLTSPSLPPVKTTSPRPPIPVSPPQRAKRGPVCSLTVFKGYVVSGLAPLWPRGYFHNLIRQSYEIVIRLFEEVKCNLRTESKWAFIVHDSVIFEKGLLGRPFDKGEMSNSGCF